MSDTPRTGLTYWDAGISQPDIPYNDSMLQLDATHGLSVISATTTAQPGSPTTGQAYILPASPTGTNWAGKATGTIALYYGTTWYFYAPWKGLRARAADSGYALEYVTAWVRADTLSGTQGAAIASATTTDLSTATGDFVHITGTTTITGLGTCVAGIERTLIFDGSLTFTHNATSLILPTGANITTAAGDAAVVRSEGSGNWRCIVYQRKDGTALTGSGSANSFATIAVSGQSDVVADSATDTLTLVAGSNVTITTDAGTDTITIAASGGAGTWTTLKKSADQTRTSTATLADDSELVFALSASTHYAIRGKVFIETANATMDYKWGLAYSSTITREVSRLAYGVAGASGGVDAESVLTSKNVIVNGGDIAVTGGTSGVACITFDLLFQTNGAGNFKFQWAQNTSDAGNCTVYEGSYIEYSAI